MNPPPPPPSIAEIADLLTWARRLTHAGRHGDPAERAAYLRAKTSLLARITGQHQSIDCDQPLRQEHR